MTPLIKIKNLKKSYLLKKEILKALDDVSFDIYPGEILGLVGESGCGKSTLARSLMRLFHPTSGSIHFEGQNIFDPSHDKECRREIQMIFQDPFASLNPRMNVGEIIEEPLVLQTKQTKKQRQNRIEELLDLVGFTPDQAMRYPHEFSGGQRQRIGIARALALNPRFIICDEPIAALDVSIQAQIVNLLKKLQRELDLTYLFISHDLSMVRYLSTRVAVMYLGKIVELAPTQELYSNPLHPYTQALLSAIPIPDPIAEKQRTKIVLKGDVPSPTTIHKGCPFASRCPKAMPHCHTAKPHLRKKSKNHFVSCHLYDKPLKTNK